MAGRPQVFETCASTSSAICPLVYYLFYQKKDFLAKDFKETRKKYIFLRFQLEVSN